MPLRLELSTACPASTYSSVAIKYSYPRWWLSRAADLRLRLGRPVQFRLGRSVPLHDDRRGETPALIVAGTGAVPVVPRAVELEVGRPARMVHQPDELVVTVARQDRAVSVLVIVEDLELDLARMRQYEDPRVVDQLVFKDPDGGAHLAVGSILGDPDSSAPEYSTERRPVLLVQPRYLGALLGNVSHGTPPFGVRILGGCNATTFFRAPYP